MTEFIAISLHNVWLYGFLALIVFTLVIIVHELGHFFSARILKVKVENFSLGFGREIFGFTDKNQTRWSLRTFPIGGFVKLHGENEGSLPINVDLTKAFFNKSPLHRSAIAASGSLMNFIFGVLFLVCIYMTLGRPSTEPIIVALEVNSPAIHAGIKIGDIVTEVEGRTTNSTDSVKAMVAPREGQETRIKIRRKQDQLEFKLVPKTLEEKNDYGFKTHRGYIGAVWPTYGFAIANIKTINGINVDGRLDFARALLIKNFEREITIKFGENSPDDLKVYVSASRNKHLLDPKHKDYNSFSPGPRPIDYMKTASMGEASTLAITLFSESFTKTSGVLYQVVTRKKETKELGGVIKISRMTADMAQHGIYTFLIFIAVLSINIGFINLLPIPMLDGGYLLFYGLEAMKGKPFSFRAKAYVYGYALIFLLFMALIINLNDMLSLMDSIKK